LFGPWFFWAGLKKPEPTGKRKILGLGPLKKIPRFQPRKTWEKNWVSNSEHVGFRVFKNGSQHTRRGWGLFGT